MNKSKEFVFWANNTTGRVDNLLFYRRNRRRYVRVIKEIPPKKSTPLQLLGQARFRYAVALYRAFRESMLREVWRVVPRPAGLTGYHLFIRVNYPIFSETGIITDYSRLQVSAGVLRLPMEVHAEECDGEILITWGTSADELLGDGSDRLYVVLMYDDNTFRFSLRKDLPVYRRDGYARISLMSSEKDPIHLYYFFGNADGSSFSGSGYRRLYSCCL